MLNKYIYLKKKYIKFKNIYGGMLGQENYNLIYNQFLNNINEETFISGFSSINQWYNLDKNNPKTITIIGETHYRFSETEKCNNNNNINIIDIIYKLLQGSNECIDFILEDNPTGHILKFVQPKYSNDKMSHKEMWENNRFKISSSTKITNIRSMLEQDMYPDRYTKKKIKEFKNSRIHYSDLRYQKSYIFPEVDGLFHIFNEEELNNFLASEIYKNLNIEEYFNDIKTLLYFLSGIINLDEIEFKNLYYNILTKYYFFDKELPYNGTQIPPLLIKNNCEWIINNQYYEQLRYIEYEINDMIYVNNKNKKNIEKIDYENRLKYINFFSNYYDISRVYSKLESYIIFKDSMIELYSNFFHFINIYYFVCIETYTITRSLKIFALDKQDDNLEPISKCYNKNTMQDRNILYYHGNYHSLLYYLFWKKYFGRDSDYNLNNNNSSYTNFNYFFNNLICYNSETDNIELKQYILDESNIFDYMVQITLVRYFSNIELNYDYDDDDDDNDIEKIQNNISNFYILNDFFKLKEETLECIKNTDNIFKKILLNISKPNNNIDNTINVLNDNNNNNNNMYLYF